MNKYDPSKVKTLMLEILLLYLNHSLNILCMYMCSSGVEHWVEHLFGELFKGLLQVIVIRCMLNSVVSACLVVLVVCCARVAVVAEFESDGNINVMNMSTAGEHECYV